jgi:hypothetical protein
VVFLRDRCGTTADVNVGSELASERNVPAGPSSVVASQFEIAEPLETSNDVMVFSAYDIHNVSDYELAAAQPLAAAPEDLLASQLSYSQTVILNINNTLLRVGSAVYGSAAVATGVSAAYITGPATMPGSYSIYSICASHVGQFLSGYAPTTVFGFAESYPSTPSALAGWLVSQGFGEPHTSPPEQPVRNAPFPVAPFGAKPSTTTHSVHRTDNR